MTPQANDLRSVLAEMRAWRGHTGFPSDRLNQWADRLTALAEHDGEAVAVAGVEIGLMRERGVVEWYTNDGFSDDPPPPGTILYTTPPPQPRGDMVLACEVCGRAVLDRNEPCAGFLAPCGRRLARLEGCGTVDCVEALAAAPGEGSGEVETGGCAAAFRRNMQ